MGELNEQRWSVLSERGCEAIGLTYADAEELMYRLAREKVSGLCVITNDAARRAALTENSPSRKLQPNGTAPKNRK